MKNYAPDNLVHRGTVEAAGFLFAENILGMMEARRRVVALWHPGARIFRVAENLMLHLPEAVSVDARHSPGLPLIREGGILTAFPLDAKLRAHLGVHGECLVYFSEGRLKIIQAADLIPEEIGAWFSLEGIEVIETETLGEPASAVPITGTLEPKEFSGRAEFKDVPSAHAEFSDILAKLKELQANKNSGAPVQGFPQSAGRSSSTAAAFGTAAGFFAALAGGLKSLFAAGSPGASAGGSGGYTKGDHIPDARGGEEQETSNALARLYNRLQHLAVKMVIEMRLARIFGRRQAKYLAEMMDKFERGDLSEALRYAIPLEDMQALQSLMQKPASLFVPRPRADLKINPGGRRSRSNIQLGGEWFSDLRATYRRAFEQLEAQGRIEEASFVLAELLKSNAEAVEFLAKHGKFRLAAQLAEARGLPKETIVRQWFLAGDKDRAIRLAILYNCFEYAVTKLEQSNREAGAELREIWAESLAASGNYPAAVDVLWQLESRRAHAGEWIDKTIEFGGAAAGRMLARKVMLSSNAEDFDALKAEFAAVILRGADGDAVDKRNAFARAVFKQKISDMMRPLLRPLVRRISADAEANASQSLELKEFRELVVLAKDNALRTDLPAFPLSSGKVATLAPLASGKLFELHISENDRGTGAIYDACTLPGGKSAIALGETGVKIYNRYGKQIAYFDQPAHQLVVADHGTRAIAVARRGESLRLARLDFIERRGAYWADAKLSAFAPNYDGSTWFAGNGDEFYAIDAHAEKYEALWRVPEIGGTVYAVARSKGQVKFLTVEPSGQFETWFYELPNLTLRSRITRKWLEISEGDILYSANISEGGHSAVIMQAATSGFYVNFFDHEHLTRRFDFPADVTRLERPQIFSQQAALTSYTAAGAVVSIFAGSSGSLAANFTLGGAQNAAIKFDEKYLTIADDCGRLLVYDCRRQYLKSNLRL